VSTAHVILPKGDAQGRSLESAKKLSGIHGASGVGRYTFGRLHFSLEAHRSSETNYVSNACLGTNRGFFDAIQQSFAATPTLFNLSALRFP
jgi:hypothetical protein